MVLGSSWVMLIMHTRPFSNTLESFFLTCALVLYFIPMENYPASMANWRFFLFGAIVSLGIFTRFTFLFFFFSVSLGILFELFVSAEDSRLFFCFFSSLSFSFPFPGSSLFFSSRPFPFASSFLSSWFHFPISPSQTYCFLNSLYSSLPGICPFNSRILRFPFTPAQAPFPLLFLLYVLLSPLAFLLIPLLSPLSSTSCHPLLTMFILFLFLLFLPLSLPFLLFFQIP